MNSKFTGKTRIFRKDHATRTDYSTALGRKKQDGEWENAFISVQFKKGVMVADRTDIEVTNGWLTFWMNKEGKPVWQIFISEFEEKQEPGIPEGFAALDDDAEPF